MNTPNTNQLLGEAVAKLKPLTRQTVSTDSDGWPELRPLAEHVLPPCPLDALPDRLQKFAIELARATETDPQMTAVLALGATAGAISRGNVVRGGHHEPIALFAIAIGESGERKSEIVKQVAKPLNAVAKYFSTDQQRRVELTRDQTEWDAANARVHRASEALNKADGKNSVDRNAQTRELEEARLAHGALGPRPQLPVLLVQDVTPERLGQRLEANGHAGIGEIAIVVDAESSLDSMTGQRTDSSVALLLKAHAGDSHADDRVGRAGVSLESPRLSLALATQPTVIRELAADKTLSQKGLLGWMMVVAPTLRAHRKSGETPNPATEVELLPWCDRVEALAKASAEFKQSPVHPHAQPTYAFASDAGYLIREFEVRLSPRLGPGEDPPRGTFEVGRQRRTAALRTTSRPHHRRPQGVAFADLERNDGSRSTTR
jgi:replicative DNA helicase